MVGKAAFIGFVDIGKAFENVDGIKMFKLLKQIGSNFVDRKNNLCSSIKMRQL